MEPKNLWELFEDTGDPMAYMMFKAAEEPPGPDKPRPPDPPQSAG